MRLLFVLLPTLFVAHAYAFEPLNTDDAATVGHEVHQIEAYFYAISANGTYDQVSDISPGEEFVGNGNARTLPITYTYGINEVTEASISASYYFVPTGSYEPMSNYVLGIKWRFMGDGNTGFNLAAKPTLTLPSSNNQQAAGLGNAATNYGINLIASYYWQDIDIHLNASYEREPYNHAYPVGGDSDLQRSNVYGVSIAPVWSIHPRLKLALDIGTATNTPTNAPTYLNGYVMMAGIYSPSPTWDLGVAYLVSGNNIADATTVSKSKRNGANRFEVGVTWRF